MKTDWQQEQDRMRLFLDGRPSPTVIELDGDRWKTSVGGNSAWFSSLNDARHAAERSTRSRVPLEVFGRL